MPIFQQCLPKTHTFPSRVCAEKKDMHAFSYTETAWLERAPLHTHTQRFLSDLAITAHTHTFSVGLPDLLIAD